MTLYLGFSNQVGGGNLVPSAQCRPMWKMAHISPTNVRAAYPSALTVTETTKAGTIIWCAMLSLGSSLLRSMGLFLLAWLLNRNFFLYLLRVFVVDFALSLLILEDFLGTMTKGESYGEQFEWETKTILHERAIQRKIWRECRRWCKFLPRNLFSRTLVSAVYWD